MGTTIKTEDLSKTIVLDLFRDSLRAYAAAGGTPLVDPEETNRPPDSKFIVTSLPTREVHYPHVIVSEAGDVGKKLDQQAALLEHVYTVLVQIKAKSNTQIFKIRDAIRAWFEEKYSELITGGFIDGEIASSTDTSWDETVQIKRWEIRFTGNAYTSQT